MTWRRALVFVHRWLGITGGLLFMAWFASGIVMIYVRMPDVDANDRRAARARLDYSSAHVAPGDAIRQLPDRPTDVRLAMLNGRPVYRASSRGGIVTIFADTGEPLAPLTVEQALAAASEFLHRPTAALRYDAQLTVPDQWTLQIRALLPVHRVRAGDTDDTVVYVSDRTGEVEMETTAHDRRWAYAGPVLHWLYFTPLRRHTAVWTQTIIWLAIAGCVMCVSGLAWGITVARRSPYAGLMRWHHYAGLIFGATTCTWIFSGLLSMDPWDWHPSTAPTLEQRDAVAGGPLRLDALPLEVMRNAVAALTSQTSVEEIEVVQFQHQIFLAASDRLVPVLARHPQALAGFDDRRLTAAAATALPGVPIAEATRLSAYDSYYYDRDNALPLPVLRVRFADPQRTWLYLDPRRGAIVRKEQRLSRANRWLYHGLHSLDFPVLYARRPLWDVVMITLSLGGLASAITSIVPGWRRIRRLKTSRYVVVKDYRIVTVPRRDALFGLPWSWKPQFRAVVRLPLARCCPGFRKSIWFSAGQSVCSGCGSESISWTFESLLMIVSWPPSAMVIVCGHTWPPWITIVFGFVLGVQVPVGPVLLEELLPPHAPAIIATMAAAALYPANLERVMASIVCQATTGTP